MSPEKPRKRENPKPSEIPSGVELFRRTTDAARAALVTTYPILETTPYEEYLPDVDKIVIVPRTVLAAQEHHDKPAEDNGFYQVLVKLGGTSGYY